MGKKDKNSLGGSCLCFLLSIVLIAADILLGHTIYSAFLVPLGAPVVTIPVFIGLALGLRTIMPTSPTAEAKAIQAVREDAPDGVPPEAWLLFNAFLRILTRACYAGVVWLLI